MLPSPLVYCAIAPCGQADCGISPLPLPCLSAPCHSFCAFVRHLCPSSKHAMLMYHKNCFTLWFRLCLISDARNRMNRISALWFSCRVVLQNWCLLCTNEKNIKKSKLLLYDIFFKHIHKNPLTFVFYLSLCLGNAILACDITYHVSTFYWWKPIGIFGKTDSYLSLFSLFIF